MPGTKAGGIKAAKTNKKIYGDLFYKTIGGLGGAKSRGGGFTGRPDLARAAASKGGKMRFNQELRDTARALRAQGYVYREIAEKMGYSPHSTGWVQLLVKGDTKPKQVKQPSKWNIFRRKK